MWACPRRSANVVRDCTGLYVVCRVRARGAAAPGLSSHLGGRPGGRALRRGARVWQRGQAAQARPASQEPVGRAPRSALDVVVLELLVERRAIDLEDHGGLGLVAAGRGQGCEDALL